jgi:hypothetical protein
MEVRKGTGIILLPSYSAEVKECVALYLRPQYVFMAWCSVKYRNNFTFTEMKIMEPG